ncbi:hypothetical protein PTKIN_Ptkin07bG0021900 [Pterospermum kingtungense]
MKVAVRKAMVIGIGWNTPAFLKTLLIISSSSSTSSFVKADYPSVAYPPVTWKVRNSASSFWDNHTDAEGYVDVEIERAVVVEIVDVVVAAAAVAAVEAAAAAVEVVATVAAEIDTIS